MYYTV